MRTMLIIIQATALTLFAVIGAHSESEAHHNCPLSSAQADVSCQVER